MRKNEEDRKRIQEEIQKHEEFIRNLKKEPSKFSTFIVWVYSDLLVKQQLLPKYKTEGYFEFKLKENKKKKEIMEKCILYKCAIANLINAVNVEVTDFQINNN